MEDETKKYFEGNKIVIIMTKEEIIKLYESYEEPILELERQIGMLQSQKHKLEREQYNSKKPLLEYSPYKKGWTVLVPKAKKVGGVWIDVEGIISRVRCLVSGGKVGYSYDINKIKKNGEMSLHLISHQTKSIEEIEFTVINKNGIQ
jgi:hypothetical protein